MKIKNITAKLTFVLLSIVCTSVVHAWSSAPTPGYEHKATHNISAPVNSQAAIKNITVSIDDQHTGSLPKVKVSSGYPYTDGIEVDVLHKFNGATLSTTSVNLSNSGGYEITSFDGEHIENASSSILQVSADNGQSGEIYNVHAGVVEHHRRLHELQVSDSSSTILSTLKVMAAGAVALACVAGDAALWLAPDPTGITKAGAVVLGEGCLEIISGVVIAGIATDTVNKYLWSDIDKDSQVDPEELSVSTYKEQYHVLDDGLIKCNISVNFVNRDIPAIACWKEKYMLQVYYTQEGIFNSYLTTSHGIKQLDASELDSLFHPTHDRYNDFTDLTLTFNELSKYLQHEDPNFFTNVESSINNRVHTRRDIVTIINNLTPGYQDIKNKVWDKCKNFLYKDRNDALDQRNCATDAYNNIKNIYNLNFLQNTLDYNSPSVITLRTGIQECKTEKEDLYNQGLSPYEFAPIYAACLEEKNRAFFGTDYPLEAYPDIDAQIYQKLNSDKENIISFIIWYGLKQYLSSNFSLVKPEISNKVTLLSQTLSYLGSSISSIYTKSLSICSSCSLAGDDYNSLLVSIMDTYMSQIHLQQEILPLQSAIIETVWQIFKHNLQSMFAGYYKTYTDDLNNITVSYNPDGSYSLDIVTTDAGGTTSSQSITATTGHPWYDYARLMWNDYNTGQGQDAFDHLVNHLEDIEITECDFGAKCFALSTLIGAIQATAYFFKVGDTVQVKSAAGTLISLPGRLKEATDSVFNYFIEFVDAYHIQGGIPYISDPDTPDYWEVFRRLLAEINAPAPTFMDIELPGKPDVTLIAWETYIALFDGLQFGLNMFVPTRTKTKQKKGKLDVADCRLYLYQGLSADTTIEQDKLNYQDKLVCDIREGNFEHTSYLEAKYINDGAVIMSYAHGVTFSMLGIEGQELGMDQQPDHVERHQANFNQDLHSFPVGSDFKQSMRGKIYGGSFSFTTIGSIQARTLTAVNNPTDKCDHAEEVPGNAEGDKKGFYQSHTFKYQAKYTPPNEDMLTSNTATIMICLASSSQSANKFITSQDGDESVSDSEAEDIEEQASITAVLDSGAYLFLDAGNKSKIKRTIVLLEAKYYKHFGHEQLIALGDSALLNYHATPSTLMPEYKDDSYSKVIQQFVTNSNLPTAEKELNVLMDYIIFEKEKLPLATNYPYILHSLPVASFFASKRFSVVSRQPEYYLGGLDIRLASITDNLLSTNMPQHHDCMQSGINTIFNISVAGPIEEQLQQNNWYGSAHTDCALIIQGAGNNKLDDWGRVGLSRPSIIVNGVSLPMQDKNILITKMLENQVDTTKSLALGNHIWITTYGRFNQLPGKEAAYTADYLTAWEQAYQKRHCFDYSQDKAVLCAPFQATDYATVEGTSFSTPFVSSVLPGVIDYIKEKAPTLSALNIQEIIRYALAKGALIALDGTRNNNLQYQPEHGGFGWLDWPGTKQVIDELLAQQQSQEHASLLTSPNLQVNKIDKTIKLSESTYGEIELLDLSNSNGAISHLTLQFGNPTSNIDNDILDQQMDNMDMDDIEFYKEYETCLPYEIELVYKPDGIANDSTVSKLVGFNYGKENAVTNKEDIDALESQYPQQYEYYMGALYSNDNLMAINNFYMQPANGKLIMRCSSFRSDGSRKRFKIYGDLQVNLQTLTHQ
jgi:hypothetical protein